MSHYFVVRKKIIIDHNAEVERQVETELIHVRNVERKFPGAGSENTGEVGKVVEGVKTVDLIMNNFCYNDLMNIF